MKLLSSDRHVPWPFYNVVSTDMKKYMAVCVLNTKQCSIWAVNSFKSHMVKLQFHLKNIDDHYTSDLYQISC